METFFGGEVTETTPLFQAIFKGAQYVMARIQILKGFP